MRVTIIGSGNVAEALARAVARCSGAELAGIAARNILRGNAIAGEVGCDCYALDKAPEADLYLIAVSDSAVADAEQATHFSSGAVVAHTAGAVSIDALHTPDHGVLYPFQTFTVGREVDFEPIPILFDGNTPKAADTIRSLAEMLSRSVFRADDQLRRRVHLSGAFACNFVNRLYGIGGEILAEANLPFELLKPLIAETAAKALSTDRPQKVQTGAAVRGDLSSQQRHLELLADDAQKTEIYKLISKEIWETSKKI